MTLCAKCGQSCNPKYFSDTRIDSRKGPVHRICPSRKGKPKRTTYQLSAPQKKGWRRARKDALRANCEVSGTPLHAWSKYFGVVDHMIPERYCLAVGINPHDPVNLICISPSVHAKKRSAEDSFLKRGDMLTFLEELNKQGWPMGRVYKACRYAGLRY